MKNIIFLIVTLFVFSKGQAQQIDLLDTLNGGSAYYNASSTTIISGKIGNYFYFFHGSKSYRTDNIVVEELSMPAGYIPYFGFGFELSGITYFPVINNSTGAYSLAKLTGLTANFVPNPNLSGNTYTYFPTGHIITLNGLAYLRYKSSSNNRVTHLTFDGTNFTLLSQPIANHFIDKDLPSFVYNNKVYSFYRDETLGTSSANPFVLASVQLNTSKDSIIPKPNPLGSFGFTLSSNGDYTPPIKDGKLYLTYSGTTGTHIVTYDGTSFTLLPHPTDLISPASVPSWILANYNNEIYFNYTKNWPNGTSLTTLGKIVADTLQTNIASTTLGGYVEYNGNLYLRFNSIDLKRMTPSGTIQTIYYPFPHTIADLKPKVIGGNLYIVTTANIAGNSHTRHILKFDGTNFSLVTDPNIGIGPDGELQTLGEALYFSYHKAEIPASDPMDPSTNTYNLARIYNPCIQPVVSAEPVNKSICLGESDTTTISFTGTGTSFQWFKDNVLMAGQITNQLILSNVSAADAGTYKLVIISACGNDTTDAFTITPNSLPTINASSGTICSGNSFTFLPTGASSYTYSSGSATVSPTTTTTYTIIGTDVNGCKDTIYPIITVNALPNVTSSSTNVSCFGGINGAATVLAGGGTAPYTYSWSPSGGTAATATSLAAGSYTCTITDANSCTKTQTVTITQPSSITSTVSSQTNVSCFGGSNGAATVTAGGGTGPYTYSWSPSGGTAATASSLAAGTYTCTITDANSCTGTQLVTITQPTVVSGTTVITNVSCTAGSNGALNLTATGGTAPYTFNWGGGSTTEDRTGLAAGTYNVTITDANGCTATASATITQPSAALSGSTVNTNVSCNAGSNGAINLTPAGGTTPYTFNWGGGITTEDRTGLAAGTYNVTITDANGCTATASATITQPASALSGSTVITNVSCNAGTNGAINLTATGGTSPYTFNWGGGITTEDRTSLSAGTYSATITDANSCTATVSATITQPAAISGTTAITNVSCNAGSDGAINLTPAGGTAPYSYNWGGGITTQDRTGLSAGTYAVTITDTNECTAVVSATVTQPASALSGTKVITNVSCNAGSNGAINITPTGGTAPYTFNWGGGITTEDRTGLSAGTYAVTITDANECTASVSATITQPSTALSGSKVITNVSCNAGSNGAINLTAAGGTAPYSYNWGGGITSEDRTGLIAGTYAVTITDANGCTAVVSSTVTQPTAIGVAWIETPVNCFGESNGAIDLTATGGTAPYTFNWGGGITSEDRTALTAGSYNVTITDGNSCPGSFTINVTQPAILSSSKVITHANCYGSSNAAINITVTGGTSPYNYFWNSTFETEDLTGISAGTYSVQISDSHGCPLNDTAIVTQPSEIVSSTVVSHVDCFGNATGAINIVPSGGVGPYTFNWGGGISTEDRSGLAAGTYALVITDATNCVGNVSTVVNQPTVLSATNTFENIACFGASTGSINVTAAGGTVPYSYNWGALGTSEDLSNVPSGNYTVTVTDDHGCTTTSSASLSQPTEITFVKDSTNIFCFGDNSGMANVAVTGGVGPYAYTWIGTSAYTETANYLTAGNYSVEITDDNGCVKFADFALTQNPEITSSFSISQCDPYSWESNYYPSSGTYQQVFTAANGCDSIVTLNLTVFGYPSISINASETIICSGESITLDANGGVSAATWDNGVINNEPFVPSETTIYTASVSNAQGCVSNGSVEVFVRELPNVFMENFADSTCLDADIVACPFATPAGGTYAGTGVIGVLLDTQEAGLGQHEVIYTVSDQYGCSNSDTSMINIVECELPYNETSLDENTEDLVSIYPNPSNGEFTIESDGNLNATITDAMGRIVQILELKSGMTSVSIANEANGFYFIIIPAHASIYKIVKH